LMVPAARPVIRAISAIGTRPSDTTSARSAARVATPRSRRAAPRRALSRRSRLRDRSHRPPGRRRSRPTARR
jgi:hypothetical protein